MQNENFNTLPLDVKIHIASIIPETFKIQNFTPWFRLTLFDDEFKKYSKSTIQNYIFKYIANSNLKCNFKNVTIWPVHKDFRDL